MHPFEPRRGGLTSTGVPGISSRPVIIVTGYFINFFIVIFVLRKKESVIILDLILFPRGMQRNLSVARAFVVSGNSSNLNRVI